MSISQHQKKAEVTAHDVGLSKKGTYNRFVVVGGTIANFDQTIYVDADLQNVETLVLHLRRK